MPEPADQANGRDLIKLDVRGDERGSLIALEGGINIPFDIARVYYVFGTVEGVSRGFHAHRTLRQVAIAIQGSCTMLLDDGGVPQRIRMDDRSIGLQIDPMVWHEMHDFSPDCVLLVLADQPYEESDYIRVYEEFAALVEGVAR